MTARVNMYCGLDWPQFKTFTDIVKFFDINPHFFKITFSFAVYAPKCSINPSFNFPAASITVFYENTKPILQDCFVLDSEIFEAWAAKNLKTIADFLKVDIAQLKPKPL